ncbi:MAG: EpsG family protein [Methylococcaceae bacterium]
MIGYWVLIGIPILLSLVALSKNKLKLSLFVVELFYILFIGLRYEVGPDREAYLNKYDTIATLSFTEALSYTEAGYASLNWVLAQMDSGMYWVNFMVAIIFVSGLIRFAKTTPLPFIALVSVTPYLVIAIGMSAARQSAAIGLVFHLMASWRQGLANKLSLSVLAVSFHYSAVMSFVFVMQSIKMPVWLRVGLLMASAVAVYPIFSATDAFDKYNQTYLEKNIVSAGALMHALLNVIPAIIYLIYRHKWKSRFGESDLLPMLAILSILSIFGVSISSTGIDRLALYLSPIQMIVYGSLPFLFGRKHKKTLSLLIIIYQLIILFWWLNFSNHAADGFLPYNNLIIHWLFD